MGQDTKIEWADHTFNPWTGCTKVSPACDHCYAEGWSKRAGDRVGKWGPGAPRVRTTDANWKQPMRWNAEAERLGVRYRVFCASLADVFDNEVSVQWRRDLFDLIEQTPHLDWLLLTKRIGNARSMYAEAYLDSARAWPTNVWIGATITSQAEADRDIPKLLAVPAAKRFLSMEPLLGPVRLGSCLDDDKFRCSECDHSFNCTDETERPRLECPMCGHDPVTVDQGHIDWVIVGGESGLNARPMHPDWARSLRDKCQAAGVPFLFKQWGEWAPDWDGASTCTSCGKTKAEAACTKPGTKGKEEECGYCGGEYWDEASKPLDCLRRVGKKAAGRLLDSRTWDEVPA